MVHLQVDGGVHDCHDQTLFERQTGGVHKLQQDGEALGVHLWVQTDGIKVALVGVREERVEEPTVATGKKRTNDQPPNPSRAAENVANVAMRSYLQAMRTVLCARNCCLFTKIVTSVRMSLLRNRFRLSRTSLAWRVNCMQLSAAQAIFSNSANKRQTHLAALKLRICMKPHFPPFATLITLSHVRLDTNADDPVIGLALQPTSVLLQKAAPFINQTRSSLNFYTEPFPSLPVSLF